METHSDRIEKRLFIVGVPRSGTTLLQSFLASHSRIHSFPETHFFSKILGGTAKKYNILFPKKIGRYLRLMETLEDESGKPHPFSYRFGIRATTAVKHFRETLDHAALRLGKTIWLEKTPAHIRWVDYIEKHMADAYFLHIIRDGKQVVASLFEASNRHPEIWGGAVSIEQCVNRWNAEVSETVTHSGKPRHFIVTYESLVRKPRMVLKCICRFLNIDFEEALLTERINSAARIVTPEETWKKNNFRSIGMNSRKFEAVFDTRQQAYIVENLTGYDAVRQMIRKRGLPREKRPGPLPARVAATRVKTKIHP